MTSHRVQFYEQWEGPCETTPRRLEKDRKLIARALDRLEPSAFARLLFAEENDRLLQSAEAKKWALVNFSSETNEPALVKQWRPELHKIFVLYDKNNYTSSVWT